MSTSPVLGEATTAPVVFPGQTLPAIQQVSPTPGATAPVGSNGPILVLGQTGTPIPVLSPAPKTPVPTPALTGPLPSKPPGTLTPGTTIPPVTKPPSAILVPLTTPVNVIKLSTGQTIIPAAASQLVRTPETMMTSFPRTLDTTPMYQSLAPADVGSMALNPPLGEFINTDQWRLAFRLTGASAAACGATSCASICQLGDEAPIPCGEAQGQVQLQGLFVGAHRVTIQTTDASGAVVASKSLPFVVDSVPPVVVIALEVDNTRVSQQTLNGVSTTFLVWDSPEPCPGYLVTSEPCPEIASDAFRITGGSLQNLRFDRQVTLQARRRLLQTGGVFSGDGPVGYRFEVVPSGVGPSLLTVAAKVGGFRDRAGNAVNLTADSSFTVYYDTGRPIPKLTRADSGRPGLTTDVNVTLLVDFGQPVTGFGPSGVQIENGTLLSLLKDDTYTDGQLYLLDVSIRPLQTLIVHLVEGAAVDYAGHASLSSNEFQVLHYQVNPAVTSTVQVTAAVALAVSGVAAAFAGPYAFGGAFSNMAVWAASDGLATPLPPVYVDATHAVKFSLFRWTCPFSSVDFTDSGRNNSSSPLLLNQTVGTGGVNSSDVYGGGNLQGGLNTKGRRLMGADAIVARALCGKSFMESVKRLERVQQYQAVGAPTRSDYDPPGRTLLQWGGGFARDSGPLFVGAVLSGNRNTTVTVVASNVDSNGTSDELAERLYQTLITDGKAVYGFLQGNLPDTANEGLQTFLCALFWICVILLAMLFLRVVTARFMSRFKNVPDILVFPSLEFVLLNAAIVGTVTASVGVIMGGTRVGKAVGGIVLTLVSLYIIWAIAYVYYHVVSNKTVAFVVRGTNNGAANRAQNGSTRALRTVAKWCDKRFAGHAEGDWEPVHTTRHRLFTARYGVFFDDLTGTPMERIDETTLSRHPSYASSTRRRQSASALPRAGSLDVSTAHADASAARVLTRRASVDVGDLARASASANAPADVSANLAADVEAPSASASGGAAAPRLTKSKSRRRSSVFRKQYASFSARTELPLHAAPTSETLNLPGAFLGSLPPGLPSPLMPPLARSVSFSMDSPSALERPRLAPPRDLLTGERYSPPTGSTFAISPGSALSRSTTMPPASRSSLAIPPEGSRLSPSRPIEEIGPANGEQSLATNDKNVSGPSTLNLQSDLPVEGHVDPTNGSDKATENGTERDPNSAETRDVIARVGAADRDKRGRFASAMTRSLGRGAAAAREIRQEHGGVFRPYYFTLQLFFYGVEGVLLASFPDSESSWTQLSLIFILKALLSIFILVLWPFQEAGPQLCEILNTVCDTASAAIAIALLAAAASGVRGPNFALGITMIALQALPIVAIIFLSSIDVVVFLKNEGWPRLKRKVTLKRRSSGAGGPGMPSNGTGI